MREQRSEPWDDCDRLVDDELEWPGVPGDSDPDADCRGPGRDLCDLAVCLFLAAVALLGICYILVKLGER